MAYECCRKEKHKRKIVTELDKDRKREAKRDRWK